MVFFQVFSRLHTVSSKNQKTQIPLNSHRDNHAKNDRRTGRRFESVVEKQTSTYISNIKSCNDRIVCIDDMEISHGHHEIGIAGLVRAICCVDGALLH